MTEAEETAKALRGLGGRLLPATCTLGPLREWSIPLYNPVYSGKMAVTQLKHKFVVGRLWKSWDEYQHFGANSDVMITGFELLEKLAEQYPEIARRLARPMV